MRISLIILFASLLLLQPVDNSCAQGQGVLLESIASQLLNQLTGLGDVGTSTTLTTPGQAIMIDLGEKEPLSHCLLEYKQLKVRVDNWKIERDTFTAEKIVLLQPDVTGLLGSIESIQVYRKGLSAPVGESISPAEQLPAVVRIASTEIIDGRIKAINTTINAPGEIVLEDIDLSVNGLVFPYSLRSNPISGDVSFTIASRQPGVAQVSFSDSSNGSNINFSLNANVDSFDLAYLAPFAPFDEKVKVDSAILGVVLDARCVNNQYDSTNKISFEDLDFELNTEDDLLSAMATIAMAKLRKTIGEQVELEFEVSGDLSDKDFDLGQTYLDTLQQSLLEWSTSQLLKSFGAKKE